MNTVAPLTDTERQAYADSLDRLVKLARELADLVGDVAVEMLIETIRQAGRDKMAATLAFALLRLAEASGGAR